MNNATIKEFNIKIKLRGDNIYDLYYNGEWVDQSGSHEGILEKTKGLIRKTLLEEK